MAVGGNVNCISKAGTDYMYEDTAGRGFLTLEEPDLTSASKTYNEGNLFWHENTLYRVTASIASGGTITVGTNCVATTIEAELEARVKTANIQHTYTSSDRNPISGEGVADALSGFSTTLDGLDDVSIDDTTLADGQAIVRENGVWINGQGGHTMIPTTNDIATITGLQNGNDNYVINAYSAKRWSNAEVMTLFTTVAKDVDTVGHWVDDWTTTDLSRSGWLWHSALHGILSDDEVEITFVFDVNNNGADSETVSVYAYRVDDDVQNGGVDGGAIAIKLNGAIQNASGVKIGVNLKRQRTEVGNLTVLT